MSIQVHESEIARDGKGRPCGSLIAERHGAVKGFCLGIAYYDSDAYLAPGIHDDQEGFYVLEGEGIAKVGDLEFPIRPGSAFLAAKGVPHAMKRNPASGPIKVLWTHGAV